MRITEDSELDFGPFCSRYYDDAITCVNIAVARQVSEKGLQAGTLDLEQLKHDVAVDSLETVFYKYDYMDHSGASVVTFLSGVVRRKLLAALRSGDYVTEYSGRREVLLEADRSTSRGQYLDGSGGSKYVHRREKDYTERLQDIDPFIKAMKRYIKTLSPLDQSILSCYFLHGKGEYTEAVLKERGMDDTAQNRHWVQVRFNRALDKLKAKMCKMRESYFDAMGEERRPTDPVARPDRPKDLVRTTRDITVSRKAEVRERMTRGIDYNALAAQLTDGLGF